MILLKLFLCTLVSLVAGQSLTPEEEALIANVFGNATEKYREGTAEECVCIEYYLCRNGTVVMDGKDLIDIRAGIPSKTEDNNINKCKDYLQVCCRGTDINLTTPKPNPIKIKGCGQRNPEGIAFKITGDTNNESQFGEFPWMIALFKKIAGNDGETQLQYHCGGALIHSSLVLTTAHCVIRKMEGSVGLVARAGEWDSLKTNENYKHQDRNVARILVHSEYRDENLWNDFALLEMDRPFVLFDHINTVCLPSPRDEIGNECYVSGWGKDKFGEEGNYQNILKKIVVPPVNDQQCNRLLRNSRLGPFFSLHQSFVCAGGNGSDACTGDGGSPLVCPIVGKPGTYEVTGLVAWGIGCGGPEPGVYARVAYGRTWIESKIKELGYTIE